MGALSDKGVSYWQLDEPAGTVTWQDIVANINDLTNNGNMEAGDGVCSGSSAFFHPGQNSSSLQRTSTPVLQNGWTEWTGWAYIPAGTQANSPIFCKCDVFPAASDYELFLNHNGAFSTLTWRVRKADNSAYTEVTSAVLGSLGWHSFDAYYRSTGIGLAIDQGAFATQAHSGGLKTSASDFAFGVNPSVGSMHFNSGNLSSVGMWGEILTDAERAFLRGDDSGVCPATWADVVAFVPHIPTPTPADTAARLRRC